MLTVGQSNASQTTGAETMRLGYVPLINAAPLLIAQKKGFFRRHGLGVTLQPSTMPIAAATLGRNGNTITISRGLAVEIANALALTGEAVPTFDIAPTPPGVPAQ